MYTIIAEYTLILASIKPAHHICESCRFRLPPFIFVMRKMNYFLCGLETSYRSNGEKKPPRVKMPFLLL